MKNRVFKIIRGMILCGVLGLSIGFLIHIETMKPQEAIEEMVTGDASYERGFQKNDVTRILVKNLTEQRRIPDYGAVASMTKGGVTLLEYRTTEDMKYAEEKLLADGYDVYEDVPLGGCDSSAITFTKDLLQEYGQTLDDVSGYGSVTTAPEIMGLSDCGEELVKNQYTHPMNDVVVAVLDSGIDPTHRVFKNRLVKGYDLFTGTSDSDDYFGHGTFVAGIIANNTPSNVKIMPIRMTDSKGYFSVGYLAGALSYILNHAEDVNLVHMSLSITVEEPSKMEMIQRFLSSYIEELDKAGICIITSAGNYDESVPHATAMNSFPANCEKVISVSALGYEHGVWGLYDLSLTGACVDFCAPGQYVRSAKSHIMGMKEATVYNGFVAQWLDVGDGTCVMSGTSQAAAYVTAAASMILSYGNVYTFEQLYETLQEYAVKNEVIRTTKSHDNRFGYGCPVLSTFEGAYYDYVESGPIEEPMPEPIEEETRYTVTFKYNNKVVNESGDTIRISVVEGECVEKIKSPTIKGYSFDGWYGVSGKKYDFNKPITRSIVLNARYISTTIPPTKITYLEKIGKKKFRIMYQSKKDATSYQIQYSKKKDFSSLKSVTTSDYKKTIITDKTGTYYVRVRVKRVINGKPYYSKWSTVKKVSV